jgi:hypothetical protein
VCHSGRGWRHFDVVRPAGREPVVLCGSCHARFGDDPPVGRVAAPEPEAPQESAPAAEKPRSKRGGGERGSERVPDRLRRALPELPSTFSTAMAARAAGLNHRRTLARLQELERRNEVRRVGDRWTTEPAPDDVASAMDRLQASTTNLRIVRERARVG